MDKKEILAEAKRKYPIGTKYIYVGSNFKNISEITGDLQIGSYNNIYGVNWNKSGNKSINDCNVYENGIWATIISSPIKIYELW